MDIELNERVWAALVAAGKPIDSQQALAVIREATKESGVTREFEGWFKVNGSYLVARLNA